MSLSDFPEFQRLLDAEHDRLAAEYRRQHPPIFNMLRRIRVIEDRDPGDEHDEHVDHRPRVWLSDVRGRR